MRWKTLGSRGLHRSTIIVYRSEYSVEIVRGESVIRRCMTATSSLAVTETHDRVRPRSVVRANKGYSGHCEGPTRTISPTLN